MYRAHIIGMDGGQNLSKTRLSRGPYRILTDQLDAIAWARVGTRRGRAGIYLSHHGAEAFRNALGYLVDFARIHRMNLSVEYLNKRSLEQARKSGLVI